MSAYVKSKILWYFSNRDEIIQGQWLTNMFDDSLLPYVDELVELHEKGIWKPHNMATGYPNWYGEFLDYLRSKNIEIAWKTRL